jgi:Protein of unknown function (DUF3562)
MENIPLYEDENERKQHFYAIHMLAQDAGSSEEKIRSLYESVLQEFKNEAIVKAYLTILVSKKVKQILARGE